MATLTDSFGEFTFVGMPPGVYVLEETNKPGFSDVTDIDRDNPNVILIVNVTGVDSTGNTFVDKREGGLTTTSGAPVSIHGSKPNAAPIKTSSQPNEEKLKSPSPIDPPPSSKISIPTTAQTSINTGNPLEKDEPSNTPESSPTKEPTSNSNTPVQSQPSQKNNVPFLVQPIRIKESPLTSPSFSKNVGSICGNVKGDTNNDDIGDINLSNVIVELK
jgi:hypothetical protein